MSVLAPSKRIGWGLLLLGVLVSPVHANGTAPPPPAPTTAAPAPAQPCGVPERLDALEAKARDLDGRVNATVAGRPDPRLWISVLAVGIALALAWGARGYFDARAEASAVPLKLLDALARRSPSGTIEEMLDHMDKVNAKLPDVRARIETLQKALELDRRSKQK